MHSSPITDDTWSKLEEAYFDYTYFVCHLQRTSKSKKSIRTEWLKKLRQFKLSERHFLREFDKRYPPQNGRTTVANMTTDLTSKRRK
jgi:hypothetical protein